MEDARRTTGHGTRGNTTRACRVRRSLVLAVPILTVCSACGYRLVPVDRAAHLALSSSGPVHPDAMPAVATALRARLRDEGVRLSSRATDRELDVVVVDSAETAVLPSENEDERFVPAVWDARLFARATLHRADGTSTDLGVFEASGRERVAAEAPRDDRAQSAAVETAAIVLAGRIVAAALAAW